MIGKVLETTFDSWTPENVSIAHLGSAVDPNEFDTSSLEHPHFQGIEHISMMREHEYFASRDLIGKDIGDVSEEEMAREVDASNSRVVRRIIHAGLIMSQEANNRYFDERRKSFREMDTAKINRTGPHARRGNPECHSHDAHKVKVSDVPLAHFQGDITQP